MNGGAVTTLRRLRLGLVPPLVAGLVIYKLLAQMAAGPDWDSYSFLANAAEFAGRGIGYTEPARPPLISLFTAVPLALGFFDARAIQVVDALLALVSLAGFYLLFRCRLSRAVAALATLGLLASPVVWEWLGVGYTDFAAMGLCAWALYFAIRAAEDNPWLYCVSFPLLVAASLMRFTSLLFVFPVGVYLALRSRPFRHARYLAAGVAAAVLFYAPFAWHYQRLIGDALYPYVASTHVEQAGSAAGVVQQLDSFATSAYWLAAPRLLGALTVVVFALAALGLAQGALRFLRQSAPSLGRVVLGVSVAAIATWLASRSGLAVSQVAVSAGVYLVWRILASEAEVTRAGTRRRVAADFAVDAAMLAWTLAFFCFHDSWAQRVTRYYITMAPGVVYFVALGWRTFVAQAPDSLGESAETRGSWLRTAAGVPLALVLLGSLGINMAATSWTPDPAISDARQSAQWLASRPGIADSRVYSDMWPVTAWYLRRDVDAMPLFDNLDAVGHELDVSSPRYYVTNKPSIFPAYHVAYSNASGSVLERRDVARTQMPRLLYLGAGWENYLEELSGYGFALVHDEGDYDLEGTAFLDGLTPDELSRYSTIAAFGMKWHHRSAAERSVAQWVADGGTLVIDASHNLEQPTSLDGSVLFDTVIRRAAMPADTQITLDQAFASAHPEIGALRSEPWVGESGEPWFGAAYSALPGSAPLKVLASAGGRPLVLERRWGMGRVLWLAYNLPFHAHLTESTSEARLVSAVLADALGDRELASRSTRVAQTSTRGAQTGTRPVR